MVVVEQMQPGQLAERNHLVVADILEHGEDILVVVDILVRGEDNLVEEDSLDLIHIII